MSNETDSFVQEVDESLRQDRLLQLGRRYGPYVLGGVVALILGVIAWQIWEGHRIDSGRRQAEAYAAAQQLAQDNDLDAAKAEFERLSQTGPSQYRLMARMEHAAVLQAQGDLVGALAEFDRAAEEARDPIMRQTAQMRAAYIAADTSSDFAALQSRLQPLINNTDSRYSYLARELLGVEAWEAGEIDLARDTLENLTLAFDAPEALRQRAQLALSVIGPAPANSADGASTTPAPSEGETK